MLLSIFKIIVFVFTAPVIKGVEASNGVSPKKGEEENYDDIEIDDEDDDEEEVNEEEINPHISTSNKNSDSNPIITNIVSLSKSDSEQLSPLSNQKAKKSFKPTSSSETFSITISPKTSEKPLSKPSELLLTTKRSLENDVTHDQTKKLKIDSQSNILTVPKPQKQTLVVTKPVPNLSSPQHISSQPSVSQAATNKVLCSCESEPIIDNSLEGEITCQAVENVGGHRVGCKNKVTRMELVRISGRNHAILCDLHRERFASHGCCPLCGEFCSHGLVFMCRTSKNTSPHLFHRSCYMLKSRDDRMCPHCGSRRAPIAVQLKMSMSRAPLKLLSYTAKMSAKKSDDSLQLWQTDKVRENLINYTLPNGKVISADGLPKGLEPAKIEEIITTFNSKTIAKVTTRNMYVPTAAGDNVKLLQLLALNYSPRQQFPEVDGGGPLHVAAANNHPLTAHILLQAGADIDAFDDNNETPLMIAAYNVSEKQIRNS